ncbi:MAG: TetR/AcrR family transcriptional regulator C-terminal ligand-binding domain-containing protein [Alphaproteobacteria bacterium]|nr:TetR/AcrR family transcriptional regulator C-terminal ligand-binding domain-containing protein [Alphaproteobacteria bacterium]
MGRPAGRRNDDHDEKRVALCRAMVPALLDRGRPATLAHLAATAGVSAPTLRHYFGDLDGVVQAVLATADDDARGMLAAFSQPSGPVRASLTAWLALLVDGWRQGPLRALVVGSLAHGLEHPTLGPAAVEHVLEPTSRALEGLIRAHVDRGELPDSTDARITALLLLGPVVLALLHQDDLSGATCRPLDLRALVEAAVDAVVGSEEVVEVEVDVG